MKDSTAYLMNNVLESAVTSGFNGGANVSGSHVAAKTGTSNYPDAVMKQYKLPGHAVNDLWTVAYTSKYSIGVWYGYESVLEGYNTSGSYKDSLTKAVMKYIPKDKKGWTRPSSVVASQVELETYPAKLPSEYTPSNLIRTEYFVRGTQPTEKSERFAKLNDITNAKTNVVGNTANIVWEYVTPTTLSDEYLDKYFSQNVFAKSKDELIESRKNYNTNTLGNIVFKIYQENPDGTLKHLHTTSEYSYIYTGTEPTTLIIKAQHSNFDANASNGIKLTINITPSTPPSTQTTPSETLTTTLNGPLRTDTMVGNYIEQGVNTVLFGATDVTNKINVKYQIIINNIVNEFSTKEAIQNAVNQLPAGNYSINYIITYDKYQGTKKRTISLK